MLTKADTKADLAKAPIPVPANPDTTRWLRLASFATLTNQKLVVLSNSADYVAVDWHFFTQSLLPLISRIRLVS